MRPKITADKIKNISDFKLYFTDHETLNLANPRGNDMVFVPKKA
jgi:hypothetical protein